MNVGLASALGQPEQPAQPRRIGGIPVRNLYVMLAFGDALSGDLSPASCGALETEQLPLNIIARLLVIKLGWIRRRGTPRSYRVRDDVGAAPEGSLDLSATLRGMHLLHNRVAFRVDELQVDTPQNRLLCAGIRALLRSVRVKAELRDELRRSLPSFAGVSYMSSVGALRVAWTTTGSYASYREALGLARLAVLASLPDEGAHDQHWRKLMNDHAAMGQLFERFVRGFLRIELGARAKVRTRHFEWSDPKADAYVPRLQTDLFITNAARTRVTVGECKLYKQPLASAPHSGVARLRSAHLNQLFAYLCAARADAPTRHVEGLLIYGQVDHDFGTEIMLRQFPVRVRTLNLHEAWPQLREQLVGLWLDD